MWLSYQTTLFYWPEQSPHLATKLAALPDSFIILTACNPKGAVVTDDKNAILHDNLRNTLLAQQLNCFEITGTSPDLSHQETGFAIGVSVEQGITLGCQFRQNAIYYIEHDELWLVPVLMNQVQKTYLGRFTNRLIHVQP